MGVHTMIMHAPQTGHYLATLAIVRPDREHNPNAPPPSALARGWAALVEFVDGSVTDHAHAPEMVRAIMVDGAERAIRFRVTASPDWRPADSLTGSSAHDLDLVEGDEFGGLTLRSVDEQSLDVALND